MAQRRVTIAQPAALCREGAGLLQVGVLRWMLPPRKVIVDGVGLTYAAEPGLTILVKATFSYAKCSSPADEMVLADEPEGLALDVPSELQGAEEDEIAYSSDFVPLKRLGDVLVTGHAYSSALRQRLRVQLRLASLARDLVVTAPQAALQAPLLRAAIRGRDGETAAEPLGPRLTPPLLEEHPFQFDFAAYNTAPASQQLDEIPHGAPLTLTGLSPRAETLSLKLPALAPVMWVDTTEERGIEQPLQCDTVWIDTDRELLVMVYRTLLLVPSLDFDGVTQVTLALSRNGAAPRLPDVRKGLERGVFEAAVELPDFDDDAGPAPEPSLFAKYEVLERRIEPTISLQTYATLSAALAESRAPRAETLALHGFDEDRFLIEERGWLTRMSEAALKGDAAPATRYGELFVQAQDGLAGPHEGNETVEEYAVLKVDVEDALDPTKVLGERKMTLAEWMRMDRRWTRKGLAERSIQAEVERLCAAYRMRRGGA